MRLQIPARRDTPDFLDLPWDRALEEWEHERLVEVVRGIGRHVVRFVSYDGGIYALKELPDRVADRERELLRSLGEHGVPVVDAIGTVTDRPRGLDGVLVTRHLDFSLPYRVLFAGRIDMLRDRLLDALAELLVRLHVTGFFWGDCSLSNTLFRRDAGALSAYLVDAETGELHSKLSEGQRLFDLEVAETNLAGELLDLAEHVGLPPEIEPAETAADVRRRYDALWAEVTREELIAPDERHRIDERLERLNELGFDTEEVELVAAGSGYRLRVDPRVVEPGYHSRRLQSLTGLSVQENQARRLLNDITGFREELERGTGKHLPEPVVAYRWLRESYEPAVDAIPAHLRGKLEPAEVYHQLLEHRWFLSEERDRCVSLPEAVRSYVDRVLAQRPDERLVPDEPPAEDA